MDGDGVLGRHRPSPSTHNRKPCRLIPFFLLSLRTRGRPSPLSAQAVFMRIHSRSRLAPAVLLACVAPAIAQTGDTQQIADPAFKPAIEKPAYARTHPLVVLDEAHENFHTVSGRYKSRLLTCFTPTAITSARERRRSPHRGSAACRCW